MEVVEVWGEAESLDRSLDVGLDVRGRVGDASVAENVKSALGGDCRWCVLVRPIYASGDLSVGIRKTLSLTLCFLMKSPKSFSLTPC